ncbi:RING finger protein unkempt isoform X14 [Chironomus tepperi]|uniref:RING finger protein unkempt isoform X14 n=1 Tax=Chironomus tepperi TaxID=113505 RepID=UPI00391EFDD5
MNPDIKLQTQTEKPNHYMYLKEFRVEQCLSFLQHKCNQHKPFVCFNWHFDNQRRRRPVRRRDGTFNYSADNYCTKYDETKGKCPDGDECPFLHRTAGDTERRYHLRYYKTCMCVHDTDSRGFCVKNGQHCAFAHGVHDQRPPVYDIKELEAMQAAENAVEAANGGGPNALDKERNLMNEDPKWQDTNYVLANYKTEPCKRPPRLCRQGYACPQYHNSKDKRRSPRKYKYRSTPCPNVKHGEEWGEPDNCEQGDNCQYCHTRTEQQFHPEIYKSTKCNDVQQQGYCPRSVFCAFAHVQFFGLGDELQQINPDGNPSILSDMINNALPPPMVKDAKTNELAVSHVHNFYSYKILNVHSFHVSSQYFSKVLQNGSAESSESASTSSIGSNNSSHNKAPGSQLQPKSIHSSLALSNTLNSNINGSAISSLQSTINSNSNNSNLLSNPFQEFSPEVSKQILAIENDPSLSPIEKETRKRFCLFASQFDLENSISAGISSSILHPQSAPVNIPNSPLTNSLGNYRKSILAGLLHGTNSKPVNIPGNYSPSSHPNMFMSANDPFIPNLSGSAGSQKINSNSFGHNENILFQPSSHLVSSLNDGLGSSISPDLSENFKLLHRMNFESRISEMNQLNSDQQLLNNSTNPSNSLFDAHIQKYPLSPMINSNYNNVHDDAMRKNFELWKIELDENNRKVLIAEKQRDEALGTVKVLTEKVEQLALSSFKSNELRGMPIQKLKTLQSKLRSDLEEVDNVLYSLTATKCMKCEENNRSVTLAPCNHYVLCEVCVTTQRECPYCQTPIERTSAT